MLCKVTIVAYIRRCDAPISVSYCTACWSYQLLNHRSYFTAAGAKLRG